MKPKIPGAPSRHVNFPPDFDVPDAAALQALARGDCPPHLQKRALDWIITQAATTYDSTYRNDVDGGDRATAFAEGRRFVGLQIVKLLNIDTNKLQKATTNG